ncbi:MAG: response regulator [Deltaproteobacteria bacterium]|nr:response regulator [Deltaproteobacteria bacterium]
MRDRVGSTGAIAARRGHFATALVITLASLLPSAAHADERGDDPGLVDLSGAWRFRTGDDERWRVPGFADATWEQRAVPVTTHTRSSSAVTAWYRRTVAVPDHLRRGHLVLAIGSTRLCSIEAYAGGRRIGGKGSLPPTLQVVAPGYAVLPIPRAALDAHGRVAIALRVWWLPSFAGAGAPRFRDGLDLPPVLGAPGAVARHVRSVAIRDRTEWALAVAGALLLLGAGIYQLAAFRSSTRAEHAWLAAFAVAEAVALYAYAVWQGELVADALVVRRVMLGCHVLMAMMIIRFCPALIGRRMSIVERALVGLLVALGASLLVVDADALAAWRSTSFLAILATAATASLCVGREAYRGHEDARVVVWGFAVFLGVAAFEVIWTLAGLPHRSIAPVGFMAVLGSMMVANALRHARTGRELEALRDNLERRVEARTRELEVANTQLLRSEERARRASEAKTEFLANMSHEIRTPLNGVLGMADVLAQSDLAPVQLSYVETIRKSGRGLLTILNDVLDLSKIEAGKLELESVPFAPDRCVRDVAELFAHAAADHGVRLSVEVSSTPPRVVGAASRLRQVLLNLVGNAVKFTSRGEIVVRLAWTRRNDARIELRVDVVDTGIGIAPEDLDLLFRPFTQVASASGQQHGGTGLGLVISRWLVERMGGRIDVESEPGVGSTFAFFVVMAEDTTVRAEPERAPSVAPPADLRVLLVEDSVINQRVATLLLESLGLQVEVVSDGREAIEAVARRRYDVVLMDVQMPGMGGIEATRRIRSELPADVQPYIVALTASAMEEDRQRCLDAGMNNFLSKPIVLEELTAALNRAALPV